MSLSLTFVVLEEGFPLVNCPKTNIEVLSFALVPFSYYENQADEHIHHLIQLPFPVCVVRTLR